MQKSISYVQRLSIVASVVPLLINVVLADRHSNSTYQVKNNSKAAYTELCIRPGKNPFERGRTLNLGETVILQREINPFISALREEGIIVTGLHNHWLFERPRLMYIHFQSIDDPISFANKVARGFRVLEDHC